MKEIWKNIKEYEGLYKISNFGNVISLPKNGNGNKLKKLTPYIIGKSRNYLAVKLYKGKKYKQYKIHRLVANHFIANLRNKPQVNHIDGNTFNNKVDNLEWCTNSENQLHAYKMGLNHVTKSNLKSFKKGQDLSKISCSIPIVQFDNNYNFIDFYGNNINAMKVNSLRSPVIKCCNMLVSSSQGYKWRYIKDCKINNKIIIISGKSASGKTFLLRELLKNEKINILVSHTTRPPRNNEIYGKDYYFIKEKKFKEKINNYDFIEARLYDTEFGVWYYGLSISELKKNNGICIVDYKGFKNLSKKIGRHNLISIYIDCDYDIRKERALNRDMTSEKNIKEIKRRFEKDEIDFPKKKIYEEYDYVLRNNNKKDLEKNINKINQIINNNTQNINNKISPINIRKNEIKLNNKWYNTLKEVAKDYGLNFETLRSRLKKCNDINICINTEKWLNRNK